MQFYDLTLCVLVHILQFQVPQEIFLQKILGQLYGNSIQKVRPRDQHQYPNAHGINGQG